MPDHEDSGMPIHDHEESNRHVHDHEENSTKAHGHEGKSLPMGNLERMETILNYWIEHNREHQREQEKWLLKAEEFGLREVSHELKKAVEMFNKAAHHVEVAKMVLAEQKAHPGEEPWSVSF